MVNYIQQFEVDDLKFQVEQLKKELIEKNTRINKMTYVIDEAIGFLKLFPYKTGTATLIDKLKSL